MILAIVSFAATLALTLIATFIVNLEKAGAFIIFSTGTSITLGVTLIEQRIFTELGNTKKWFTAELEKIFDIYKTIEEIDDELLKNEVYSLAKSIKAGEIPAHISTTRVPFLYEHAKISIYASNISLKKDELIRWSTNPRFKQILETSRLKSKQGVKLTRTFILSTAEVRKANGELDKQCQSILSMHANAGIEVRIIWIEELKNDNILPIHRIDRNFTIFDSVEAIDATNSQIIFRLPSKRVDDFIKMQQEQIKYSHRIEDVVAMQTTPQK